ncbi:MAG: prolipoprotein diacylglyceryl transferase, partial [Eubacterium sp.]|nr:prolipoprotein diacylglyceryl transferase [Eubacterium sp.]
TNTDTALFRMWSEKIRDNIIANQGTLAEKGMQVDPNSAVHPTFLYESVWCILLFIILHIVVTKFRSFKGEVFLLYGIGYGLERMVVEGMRTDSLYIGSTTIRVSQLLSALIVVAFSVWLAVLFVKLKKGTLPRRYMLNPPAEELPQAEIIGTPYVFTVCKSKGSENDFFKVIDK